MIWLPSFDHALSPLSSCCMFSLSAMERELEEDRLKQRELVEREAGERRAREQAEHRNVELEQQWQRSVAEAAELQGKVRRMEELAHELQQNQTSLEQQSRTLAQVPVHLCLPVLLPRHPSLSSYMRAATC